MLNMNDPNDLETIRKLLLSESDDEEDVVIDESDTDEEEHISERENDSESEMSAESNSENEDNDDKSSETYVAHLKKNRKIIDSWVWHKKPFKKTKRAPRNICIHVPGVIGPAKNLTDIVDIWKCLITDSMIESIVEDTNMFISSVRPNYSRERDARDTNGAEINALFGLLYLAGIYHSNRVNLEELWRMDDFKVVMNLKRFLFLLRALRFDNIHTRAERRRIDRLAPIRNIFQEFVNNCQKCYSLGENVTIDEKLEGFRGRCGFIQYIPKKPNKYGIKIYAMVDARMFYTYNMEIYSGTQPDGRFSMSNKPRDVVKRLTEPIYNTGRNVTTDNWFSSFDLVQDLDEKKLSFVGTLKKNKSQIPSEFKLTKKRDSCTSLFGFRKDMTLLSYVPKRYKNVILISSLHDDAKIDEDTGVQKKPEIITFYNLTKGGVDTVDKLCASYNVARNTRRWPMVVFFSMLNVAGINSYIIHSTNNNEKLLRRQYLRQLADALVKENVQTRKPTSLHSDLKLKVLKRKAQLGVEEEVTSGKKRCKPCQNDKRTRITRFNCEICYKFICLEHSKHICSECNDAMK